MNHVMLTMPDANALYVNLLSKILEDGETVSPRGMETKELRPAVLKLLNPRACVVTLPERDLNYSFMVAEWLWIALGRNDVSMISHYNKNIGYFSDDGETYFGAYGPRIRAQQWYALKKLESDADTRQAVINIWREVPPETKDVPCTLSLHFMLRNEKLELSVCMRSSDAWLGLPYDLFNFAQLQSGFASDLGVESGPLTLHLASSHLYAKHFDAAADIANRVIIPDSPLLPPVDSIPPDWLDAREEMARVHGVVDFARADSPWAPYFEALAYRTRGDITHGSGFMMEIIRKVKEQQS